MESATIQYGRLDADELAANTRWWEIYEECFPLAGEREPPFAIIDSVRKEAGTAFRAHEHGRTIAIARTHALADHKDFLAYIGVTASYRRQGVADALFRALPNRDKIFEVEDPEHAALYDTTPMHARPVSGGIRRTLAPSCSTHRIFSHHWLKVSIRSRFD